MNNLHYRILERKYNFLKNSIWNYDNYSIVAIRDEDKHLIMKWRNEQLYHLRQSEPLTIEKQEQYFAQVVAPLFNKSFPNQILFSYLKNNTCIGYGGLVHINWHDKNAEISFVMDTSLENKEFELHWQCFLKLIQKIAFIELDFHKIYTYAFDLRPKLYSALSNEGFKNEAVLVDHIYYNNAFINVLIHSKLNNN